MLGCVMLNKSSIKRFARPRTKLRDWMYLAGLVDGEGSISMGGRAKYHTLRVTITNTHYPTMKWVHNLLGGSFVQRLKSVSTYKTCYQWSLHGKDAQRFLARIHPYTRIKREQITLALMLPLGNKGQKIPEEQLSKREELFLEIRRLNNMDYNGKECNGDSPSEFDVSSDSSSSVPVGQ